MKKIKSFKVFLEDATASASSTAGAGAVSSASVSGLPGVAGTSGSGDLSFYFKKEKRKKGGPSQVSDLRDLKPEKTTKVEDIKESIEWNEFSEEDKQNIENCLVDLTDMGFELNQLKHDIENETVDVNDDETASFQDEEVRIALHKIIKTNWTGNISIRGKFDKSEMTKSVMTLRGRKDLTEEEEKMVEILDDITHKMINLLNYKSGSFTISYAVYGSAMPFNEPRNINVNIHIILNRHVFE
jgi:hypothetical protein